MSKEVAKKEETKAVAVADTKSVMQMWDAPQLSQKDFMMPSILLMQPMSPQVTDGKAAFGEFRESLNMDVLGSFDKGFDVVPFKLQKVFQEYIDNGSDGDKEFLRQLAITPENENLPYQDVEVIDGVEKKIQRDRCMKFLVLLVDEIKLGTAIPYILSLKRTSFQTGQKLATQMFIKNINSNKTPASTIMTISATKQTQDKKTWGVVQVAPSGPAPDSYVAQAFKWVELANAGKLKEHNTEAVNRATGEIKEDIPF